MKHRLALLTGILALLAIALGAYLTGEIRAFPNTPPATDRSLEHIHRIAGYVVAALSVALGAWVMNPAGWLTIAAALAEALTGSAPFLHAFLSPVLLACIAAVAVTTSKSWQAGPQPVATTWRPIKTIGILLPILILMQVGLGAAARHNGMNPISHVMNAFIVVAVFLTAGVFVVRQYPDHPSLKPAALALLIIAGIQVFLGFTVYLILLMSESNNMGLIITGVLHVTNGALTLAASVVLAMEMNRNITKTESTKAQES
jgi:heme A synthase